jgi:TraY domain
MDGRKRAGRPTTTGKAGEKATLGIRASADLKQRLDEAAKLNGRSLSQEAELRLEQSFRQQQDLLLETLATAYGPRLAVMIISLARGLGELQRLAEFPSDWIDDPRLYALAKVQIDEALPAFAPEPEPEKGHKVNEDIGRGIIRSLLWSIKHPAKGAASLREWAEPLHRKLGEHAARLRISERGVMTTIHGEKAWLEGWTK